MSQPLAHQATSDFTPDQPTKPFFPSLDGARGLAVVLVVFCHMSSAKFTVPGGDFKHAGALGVYLFFALSAFLLTIPFCSMSPEELLSGSRWANYLTRRFQRIIPMYAIALLFLHWLHQPLSNEVKSLSLHDVCRWLLMRDGQVQFWTIPVEVKYYFLLPLLVLALAAFLRINFVAGIGALFLLYLAVRHLILPWDNSWSLNGSVRLTRTLPVFLLGSAAGSLHVLLSRRPVGGKWTAWLFEILAILSLGMVLLQSKIASFPAPLIQMSRGLFDPFGEVLYFGVFWSLFLLSHLHGVGLTKRLFAWLPLRSLGWISFSTYLFHKVVLNNMQKAHLFTPLRFPVTLSAVIIVGALVYWLLERPITKLRFGRFGCTTALLFARKV